MQRTLAALRRNRAVFEQAGSAQTGREEPQLDWAVPEPAARLPQQGGGAAEQPLPEPAARAIGWVREDEADANKQRAAPPIASLGLPPEGWALSSPPAAADSEWPGIAAGAAGEPPYPTAMRETVPAAVSPASPLQELRAALAAEARLHPQPAMEGEDRL